MYIVQTPQDKSPLPREAAGYTLADNRTLPPDAETNQEVAEILRRKNKRKRGMRL